MTAEFLLDSITGVTETGHISKEFVGIILLPIVGNAAGMGLVSSANHLRTDIHCLVEHVTAVTVSVKDKLNLSLGVAVGSSIVSHNTSDCNSAKCFPLANCPLRHSVSIFQWHCRSSATYKDVRFIVTLAWILKKPLTLLFDPYESVAMFLSGKYMLRVVPYHVSQMLASAVLTVNYVVQDGKSNWLEGFILMC